MSANNLKTLAIGMKIDDLCEYLHKSVDMEQVREVKRDDGIDFVSEDHDPLFSIVSEIADYSYDMSDEFLEEFRVIIDMSKDMVSFSYIPTE